MTTAWKGFQLITNLEEYNFSREIDIPTNQTVPWCMSEVKAAYLDRAYYLFRDLYMDALEMAPVCRRGDRIDVSVGASYCDADRFKAAEMLSEVATERGLQFVCYTKTGAVFIKL